MTVDGTAPPGVFRIGQNGSAAAVSGTTLTIESGGSLRVESGGSVVIASGGSLTYADGATPASPVTVQSTTSGTITNAGYTSIGTTIASAYTLAAMTTAGVTKRIACTVHGASTVSQVITFAGSATALAPCGGTTAAVTTITFTEPGVVELISATTAVWHILATSGSVALT